MSISKKQFQIMAFPYTDYDTLISDGAIRSGKTSVMTWAFVKWAMDTFRNQRFAICGKTVGSATENIIKPFMAMTDTKQRYHAEWKRSEKQMIVSYRGVTNIFEVFGGKDESSYALIQGRTLAGAFLDEVALQPRSFVEQALARCSVDGSKFWFNCNPASPSHWFYKEWVCKLKKHNALRLHFELTDNPSLSEKKLKQYHDTYEGVFYQRYILGLWVAAEGAIYTKFADNPNRYIIDSVDPSSIQYAMIGVDFGGNGSATAMICNGITHRMKSVVTLDEHYFKGIQTPDELEQDFVDFVRRCKAKYKVYQVFCDSAEQTLIQGLRSAAIRNHIAVDIVNAQKGEINDRIRFYNRLMGTDRYKVLSHCKHLIEAFNTAVWDDKSVVKDVRLDNGTTNIDSLDALEYSTESVQEAMIIAGG